MGAKTMGSQGGGGVQQHTWMAREGGSLYSLTLNEVENQLEKPLGSMNLDELLKTVCSAEASPDIGLSIGKQPSVLASSSSVHWQPNFVVSGDLSNKTVDEVWRSMQHKRRQMRIDQERVPALGEMTLEDFLAKAGIVSRQMRKSHDLFDDCHDEFCQQSNWMQYELLPVEQTRACQPQHQQLAQSISGIVASHAHNLQRPIHTGVSPIMDVVYPETQLAAVISPTRGTVSDTQTLRRKRVATGEMVEKTVERRQKRMIKNRESAARSRARKQAYTNELENKISFLEEEIERLKNQQDVEKEMQCAPPPEPKFHLRRTNSGPL